MNSEGVKVLSEEEIRQKLVGFPGWILQGNKIVKEFVFPSFSEGVKFINSLAPFCDSIDHHPDVHIYYKKFVFELTRYSLGGKVTDRDFIVAAEIEKRFKNTNIKADK